ncbi:hypothetical protein HY310_03125 [Candidatus Microgenomates bacterium]|nr:hypothetical protein [Candidatus Microgenomates bacterium]
MDFWGGLQPQEAFFFYILSIWSLAWKGFALWKASKQNQRNWFIVMLILNTIGILEIVYLFRFSKKRMTIGELKEGLKTLFMTKPKAK